MLHARQAIEQSRPRYRLECIDLPEHRAEGRVHQAEMRSRKERTFAERRFEPLELCHKCLARCLEFGRRLGRRESIEITEHLRTELDPATVLGAKQRIGRMQPIPGL